MTREEITPGMTFGKMIVIEYVGKSASKHSLWLCRCECGNERVVRRGSLTTGHTVSCGCFRRNMKVGQTHGDSKSRLYNIWNQMRHRCQDKKHISYHNYGGRGIVVCDQWSEYEEFREWAYENGYSDELEIDRINNDGNYTPGNCRWITKKANSNNRRTNRMIVIGDSVKTMKQWSESYGIKYKTFRYRLERGIVGHDLLKSCVGRNRDDKGRYC